MKRMYAIIGMMLCGTLLHAQAATLWEPTSPLLGSCTGKDTSIFKDIPYDDWEQTYEAYVSGVIETALRGTPEVQCDSASAPVPLADESFVALAMELEPWKQMTVPPARFTIDDATPVLMELLRVYECAHFERLTDLSGYAYLDRLPSGGGIPDPADALHVLDLFSTTQEQQATMIQRLTIARPTLERALGMLGGYGRLRNLSGELTCVQQASLDIRNAVALTAEASACLPRIWNARDPLRDPPECSDGYDNDNDGTIDIADDGCTSPSDLTE